MSNRKWYEVLEVSPNASEKEVSDKRLLHLQAWHPDKFSNPELKKRADEKTKEINAAWDEYLRSRKSQSNSSYKETTNTSSSQKEYNGSSQKSNKQESKTDWTQPKEPPRAEPPPTPQIKKDYSTVIAFSVIGLLVFFGIVFIMVVTFVDEYLKKQQADAAMAKKLEEKRLNPEYRVFDLEDGYSINYTEHSNGDKPFYKFTFYYIYFSDDGYATARFSICNKTDENIKIDKIDAYYTYSPKAGTVYFPINETWNIKPEACITRVVTSEETIKFNSINPTGVFLIKSPSLTAPVGRIDIDDLYQKNSVFYKVKTLREINGL